MKLLEKIRNKAFWSLDLIKGQKVKAHLEDVRFIIENFESNESFKRRENHLKAILNHATSTTTFYKQFSGKKLNEFPVINKNIIKANLQNFISNKFDKNNLVKCTTSGSTGTPFVLYQDENKKQRNTADTICFANRAGYKPGHKLFYLKIWSDLNHKNPLLAWMQNVQPIEVIRLSDEKIAEFLELLKRSSDTIGLLGYSSALEQICRYLDKNEIAVPLKTNVHSIISMSETLNQYTKDALTKYFGVPAVSRYSNIECGILAQQCPDKSNEFHLNFASYVVEIFDIEKDEPAQEGELGRIVVTDLFNYGMPFIRYDTGDIGSISFNSNCEFKTPVLNRLEGRKLDLLYNTSGELVSSLMVYKHMWKYTEIDQYQLIQRDIKHYVIKVSMEGDFKRKEAMINEFKSYLGEDGLVEVELVDDIPLLNSGKRKKVVNEYYN